MKSLLLTLLLPLSIFAQNTPASLVNPFIGTGGHGHTFPGATTPFGMVQLSPDTRIDGSWDGCGGYHYSDSVIYGFSHTHLSGTGVPDYGDIMLMPMLYGKASADKNLYSSPFSHDNEKAGAGWYEVFLEKHQIKAELTASTRTGVHRYTYPDNSGALIIDLQHRDKLIAGKIEDIDSNSIRGYRISNAWAREQHVYYEMVFSEKITDIQIASDDVQGDVHAIIQFEYTTSPQLDVRVGISFASNEGARLNLETEGKDVSFEQVKANAIASWNKELSRIQIEGESDEQQKIFYSALYHTMLQPNTASDFDGRYRGMDQKIHQAEGFTYYTVFSLWDTFRAAHPLYTILYPERTRDFIRTFLKMYEQGGRLPVWELCSNETDCMIGYHSVSVIADAYAKGIRDFDTDLALEAMKKSANWEHLGLPAYIKYGQLMMDDESESISKTLEYAYDDWCIASFAEAIGKKDVATEFYKRSQSWKNIFDPQSGFMRPKQNGAWLAPFEPREVNNHFTEANSWQYSFFVPHDIQGLSKAHGGDANLSAKLEELFSADSKTTGREQSDITGLIGQYAHGNEPSHHMAWMFNLLGKPERTQYFVNRILDEMYHNAPDGLSGNEDCGQMSAWYVLSSMGFYSFCPGSPAYLVGNPLFSELRITPVGGKEFVIKNPDFDKAGFVSSINGEGKLWFTQEDILQGKTLVLGKNEINQNNTENPFFMEKSRTVIPAPVFSTSDRTFRKSLAVSIKSLQPDCKIYYTLNGEEPTEKSKPYSGGITIAEDASIRAIAVNAQGVKSKVARSNYHRIPHDWSIDITSKYTPQYSAGGDGGIIDGLNGDVDWRKGGWQGYQGQDFECIIDLQEVKEVDSIFATFLQDTRAWIVFPVSVTFETSENGKNFKAFRTVNNYIEAEDYRPQLRDYAATKNYEINGNAERMEPLVAVRARYIKVKAKNFGKLPEWHLGVGGDAYIFIDEIRVH